MSKLIKDKVVNITEVKFDDRIHRLRDEMRAAMVALDHDESWQHYMALAAHYSEGRRAILSYLQIETPAEGGAKYAALMRQFREQEGYTARYSATFMNKLLHCFDRRAEVEVWLTMLSAERRRGLKAPNTIWDAFVRWQRHPDEGEKRVNKKDEAIRFLQEESDEKDRQIEAMRRAEALCLESAERHRQRDRRRTWKVLRLSKRVKRERDELQAEVDWLRQMVAVFFYCPGTPAEIVHAVSHDDTTLRAAHRYAVLNSADTLLHISDFHWRSSTIGTVPVLDLTNADEPRGSKDSARTNTKPQEWTEEEVDYLVAIYKADPNQTNCKLAERCTARFGRLITENSIKGILWRLWKAGRVPHHARPRGRPRRRSV